MNNISCDVCMDLIPLAKDGIASEDSRLLVEEHIKTCASCKLLYLGEEQLDSQMDDKIIVRKIKKQISYFLLTLVLLGTILGMLLTNSMNMFYNALIMPAVGGLGYLALKKRTAWLPLGLFCFTFLWQSLQFYFIEGIGSGIFASIQMSFFYSGSYTFFSIIGIAIAWLLQYAFRRDTK